MRVRRGRSAGAEDARRFPGDAGRRATAGVFQDELRMRELERAEAIEQTLLDIDEAAQRLRQERDLAALRAYKELLRNAIETATRQAYKVHAEGAFRGGGRQRLLYAVRVIDEKLVALTELLMEKERDNVAIAARLDEIRGLLLDLYR